MCGEQYPVVISQKNLFIPITSVHGRGEVFVMKFPVDSIFLQYSITSPLSPKHSVKQYCYFFSTVVGFS